ncbi:MAG: hypothetical protein JW726_19275 [Anaerolineales bacterium]|nr:hypothetical protein [Anaerolineales bacterium]
MAEEYAEQPVLFLETDVDGTGIIGAREGRWWTAFGSGGSVTLPLVMVDSGYDISNGYEDFRAVYTAMVDTSLARAPQAVISASGQRVGDGLHFDVDVTNQAGVTLGSSNSATVWVIVYELFDEIGDGRLTTRYTRAAVKANIVTDLPANASETYGLDVPALSGVVWENLRAVVLVDYRPGGTSGAFDTLQAVLVESFTAP